jgi:multidrug resistance protein, MATE family
MSGRESSDLRKLLVLAWPIVLARATQAVVGFTDALMVSPLGEDALAGVTAGALNTMALLVLPSGTVFILQSFAAQLRGRGDLAGVRRYGWYGLIIAAVAGLIAAISVPFLPGVLGKLDYTPEVRSVMALFMAVRLLSVGPAVASEALGNWYGGLGNTRVAMITGVITMIANVALNYLLIEPRFGLPGWGVVGSGMASVLATTLGFVVTAVMFVRGFGLEPAVRSATERSEAATGTKLRASELLRVLRFGLPNGVNWFLEFAAFILFIDLVVAHLGTTAIAAFNVVLQINTISFMPAFGLASSGAILVAESMGRRAPDEVPRIVKLTAKAACTWMGIVALLYMVAPQRLLGLFLPRGETSGPLVTVGTTMLMIATLWQLFDGIGMTIAEALRAAGDTTWCMVARIVLAWFLFTPLAFIAVNVMHGGIVTVMTSMTVYIVCVAALMAFRFQMGRWRTIELIEPKLVDA